ncbi:MAG TPA: ABC transporter ATP-binding protein [Acidimicrobiales bacterium]|nr:ABC transporter ATP-binding protein [Acidimicrobiales bacterium]
MNQSPSETTPALELVELSKHFGNVVAVDRISLRVEQGEFFSLLGPSGCGKSTTLRMIAGFEEPTSGRLLLDGQEGSRLPPFKRNTNLVFQSYALFPHMTVRDNVAYGPRRARLSRTEVASRVEDALRTVRMWEYADRLPKALSGGQRQRVALARGLVNHPAVLLLDEPLGALDLKLRREMQIELKEIQRRVGISFVYVTHDQEEALTLSDRIAVMNGGRVEQLGTPEEIYNRPTTRFCADFIGEANLIEVRVGDRSGDGRVSVVLPGGGTALVGSVSPSSADSATATLVLRPSRVALDDKEPPHGAERAAIPVEVRRVIFQGSVVRVDLEGPEGVSLSASTSEADTSDLRVGRRMWAHWAPGETHLVEPTKSGTP